MAPGTLVVCGFTARIVITKRIGLHRKETVMRRMAQGLIIAFMLTLVGCCRPEVMATQAVTLRPQETSMWCWAASGEMAMDFLGTDVSQCDQANKRFGRGGGGHMMIVRGYVMIDGVNYVYINDH